MGGKSTISTSEPRLNALQIQRSAYGVPIPIGWGRFRVSGNLIWYSDFTAIPLTSSTSAGGKGGNVRQENTTYTYTASVILGLCEGVVSSVRAVYRDKDVFVDGSTTALAQAGLSLKTGELGQTEWGFLTTNHADMALAYSELAYVYASGYTISSNAALQNHTFEIDSPIQVAGLADANPRDIVVDYLTNPGYGVPQWTSDLIADLTEFSTYCLANNLLLSPCLSEQQQASEILDEWVRAANSETIWSEGQLKIVPYGDQAATANGVTYTPNRAPLYDLTEDDFLADEGEDPLTIEDKVDADAYNSVQVEYLNRAHQYDVETMPADDQANIEEFGLRKQDPIKLHAICDAGVARHVAQLLLQRQVYVRLTYRFQLGWKYCLLEPMDLVTLTHPALDLDHKLVRIIEIEEDESGSLSVTAEDMLIGTANAPVYPSQSALGFGNNSGALPGDVATPVLFNPPGNLAGGALEIWAAVAGQTLAWGGCEVWVSLDGTSYSRAGSVSGAARYGVTSNALPVGSDPDTVNELDVNLSVSTGTLNNATMAEADAAVTRCWIDGEVIAYRDATLTAANRYTLSYLRRGLQSSGITAHASGVPFVRLDDAVFRYPYSSEQLGTTIAVKFLSFNVFGLQLQELSDVSEYTIGLGTPPPDIGGFAVMSAGGSTAIFAWNAVSALQVLNGGFVVIRYSSATTGATWETSAEVLRAPGNATQVSGPFAPGTYFAKAQDINGLYSVNAASLGGAESGGGGTLTVVASPSSVSRSSHLANPRTATVVASTVGGVAPLSYLWTFVSGSGRIDVSNNTAASVTFGISDLSGLGDSASAVWKCTVTDSTSGTPQVIDSNTVTITFTGTAPPSGGGGGVIP